MVREICRDPVFPCAEGRARFGAGFVDWRFIAAGNMSTGTDLT